MTADFRNFVAKTDEKRKSKDEMIQTYELFINAKQKIAYILQEFKLQPYGNLGWFFGKITVTKTLLL